jgi:hypothetical protein
VIRPDTTYQPNDRLVSWCSLCHTRYARVTVAEYHDGHSDHGAITERQDSGDPIFAYGHATSEATCSTTSGCHGGYSVFSRPKCLDCHVSHGTSSIQDYPGMADRNCNECHDATPPLVVDGKMEVADQPPGWHGCDSCHGPGGPPTTITEATTTYYPGPAHVPWPGFSGQIEPPAGLDAGSGQPDEWAARTSLLRSDNRGVCTDCHQK